MKIKAAVMYAANKPLVVEQVELDPPKAGEVLVKMVATGVCHSDLHVYTGDMPVPAAPVVLGHEGAGIVEEVGDGVTQVKKGDHVVLTFLPSCGQCRWCHTGQPNMCDLGAALLGGVMLDGTPRLHTKDKKPINNFLFVSTFAEYSVVPVASLVKVPDNAPLERICLFGCGFTTGYGAVTNVMRPKPGESVLIIGCGGLGLAAIQGAAACRAGKIIAVDVHEEKLSMAKAMGATHTLVNRHKPEETIKEIVELTQGVGVDYAGEFVGMDQTDETVAIAYNSIRKGGALFMVGVGNMAKRSLPIDPFTLTLFRKRIQGVLFGDAQFKTDIPRYVDLFMNGQINLKDMVTQEFKLEDINTCFQNVLAGNKVARQVIRF
jgi:S-(hydroxymethyl)glutathione dehydrogenase/alcohol dehydrogenase